MERGGERWDRGDGWRGIIGDEVGMKVWGGEVLRSKALMVVEAVLLRGDVIAWIIEFWRVKESRQEENREELLNVRVNDRVAHKASRFLDVL